MSDAVRAIDHAGHQCRHLHRRVDPTGRLQRHLLIADIDVTPMRNGAGPARLLDLVPGRSNAVISAWLQAQTAAFRAGLQSWRWTASPA